jgi:hypothetical protein
MVTRGECSGSWWENEVNMKAVCGTRVSKGEVEDNCTSAVQDIVVHCYR